MKKFLFLSLLAVALLFTACEIIFGDPDNDASFHTPNSPGVPLNTTSQFWAQDITNDSFYRLSAQKLAEGEYCTVWVETGKNVSASIARAMASTYDTDIYPKMKAVFGIDNITYQGIRFRDTMALADALGDDDGKLCILLLDIRDGYNPSTNPGFVGGYFAWIDFLGSNDPVILNYNLKSNERDMIYVDINPSVPGDEESNTTLAHELQHMMNFINNQAIREGNFTDTWLTEGLSAAAEYVYSGVPDTNRLLWYNMATTAAHGSRITTGNNFFAWDQYNDASVLDDYATVSLFFQWLRLQSGGGTNIYRAISRSSHSDYKAIVGAMSRYNDWGSLLKTWLAANYINAPSGQYGYMNDRILSNVRARTAPEGTTRVNLYPGEGVYSVTNSSGSTPNSGRNVRYAGLDRNSRAVNDTVVYASGALLTYNVDTNSDGSRETGTTTGIAASVDTVPESLHVGAALSGPFRISAGDMLRHNGFAEAPLPPLRLPLGDDYMGDKDN